MLGECFFISLAKKQGCPEIGSPSVGMVNGFSFEKLNGWRIGEHVLARTKNVIPYSCDYFQWITSNKIILLSD